VRKSKEKATFQSS